MRRPFSHPRSNQWTALLLVLLLAFTAAGVAGHGASTPGPKGPLFRDNAGSDLGPTNMNPATVLQGVQQDKLIFVDGKQAYRVLLEYKCINAHNANGVETVDGTAGAAPCSMGGPANAQGIPVGGTYQVRLGYTTDGTTPTAATKTHFNMSVSGTHVSTAQATFLGTFTQAQMAALKDGTELRWIVFVPLQQADCNGDHTDENAACTKLDPVDADPNPTKYYAVKVDASTPTITVDPATGFNVQKDSKGNWWIFSPSPSNAPGIDPQKAKTPPITINFVDNASGAPLVRNSIEIFRDGENQTANFNEVSASSHAVKLRYNYARTIAPPSTDIDDGNVTFFGVKVRDQVGHAVDTTGAAATKSLAVAVDRTKPTFVNAQIKAAPGQTSPGSSFSVYVNATDVAGRNSANAPVNTPRELLLVTARLKANASSEQSAAFNIPYNATLGYHRHDNLTIPANWGTSGLAHVNVTVIDPVALNAKGRAAGLLTIDIAKPEITPFQPLGVGKLDDFTKDSRMTFRIRAFDQGDTREWAAGQTPAAELGVDVNKVFLHFTVGTDPTVIKVKLTPQNTQHTYQEVRNFNPEDVVNYFFTAEDFAGNVGRYPADANKTVKVRVDSVAPTLKSVTNASFLGAGPHKLVFEAKDNAAGVNVDNGKLFWRAKGATQYKEVTLKRLGTGTVAGNATVQLEGTIPTQPDGTEVQYYVRVEDRLGNAAQFGSATAPQSALVDTVAPTTTVTSPAESSLSRFQLSWSGSDNAGVGAGSGVKDYTVQFRVDDGPWSTLLNATTLTTTEICAVANATYDFRVSASDNAGNKGVLPETAQATTRVTATESCAQKATVTVTSPEAGATVSGTVAIRWDAVSTTFPDGLQYRVEIGQGGAYRAVASSLKVKEYNWVSNPVTNDLPCFLDGPWNIRVVAKDPNGLEGSGQVTNLQLNNGVSDCSDRDGDGLKDAWEFQHFGHLNEGADGDPDGDGATNLQEFQGRTDPNSASSVPTNTGPGGPADPTGDGSAGWSWWYLLVILAFGAVIALYVVGIRRRW